MEIRRVSPTDSEKLSNLLTQLGYPGTESFILEKIHALNTDPDEELIVAVDSDRVLGFMSIHFIPQLALRGSFARISYFCVDDKHRSTGIGRIMEEYCERVARERGCDRIEVHCAVEREGACNFYHCQGYQDSPTYLVKRLR